MPANPPVTDLSVHGRELEGHADIYSFSLVKGDGDFGHFLSGDEIARAGRFHFAEHRDKFIVARSTLRSILAHYLECHAGDIRFAYPSHGKPAIAWPNSKGIHFNLSHSGERALLGIAQVSLGVDIEQIKPMPEMNQIAHTFFTEEEVTALNKLPPAERTPAFFRCWTRKEALLKGWGCGITKNLKAFQVSVEKEPPLLLQCHSDLAEDWGIHNMEVDRCYAAAVAVNSSHIIFRNTTWRTALDGPNA